MKKKTVKLDINNLKATTLVAPYCDQIQELRSVGIGWGVIHKALVEAGAIGERVRVSTFTVAPKNNKYAQLTPQKRLAELDKLLVVIMGDSK